MPLVFYIAGIIAALVCANFTYGALAYTETVHSVVELTNFQLGHSANLAIAVASGIISAIMFSTGAIIETIRRRPE